MSGNRIAILGYGNVGRALAGGLLAAGNQVVFGINPTNPEGAEEARAADPALASAEIADAEEAVGGADVVVLAVPFAALADLLPPLASSASGKVVIDATNPVGPGFTHGIGATSGAQHVAEMLPGAQVVKAFNTYGFENLGTAPPAPAQVTPMSPFAGDDADAKSTVAALVTDMGWEGVDVGPLAAALDLEHLALLWIRMVRLGGQDPHLVWAALRWQAQSSAVTNA